MSDTSGMNADTEMCLVGAAGALTVGTWDSTRSERQILFLQGAANGDECELNQAIKKYCPKFFISWCLELPFGSCMFMLLILNI